MSNFYKQFFFFFLLIQTIASAQDPTHLLIARNLLENNIHTSNSSQFIDDLLSYSYGFDWLFYIYWMDREHPTAEQYYFAVRDHRGFLRIDNVLDLLPGDLIVLRYNPGFGNEWDETGHIMIVNQSPIRWKSTSPFRSRTLQWIVSVIDCNVKGLRTDIFRLYTQWDGKIIGHSWNTSSKSIYYDAGTRPIVVGRLIPGYSP